MNASPLRLLLLQIRDPDDPMRSQEVECFRQAVGVERAQITPFDLLQGQPPQDLLAAHHAVLIGGSGQYSAAADAPWLDSAFATMRRLYDERIPTFASCWGFQAVARALGGTVVHDLTRAELGTHFVYLTAEGQQDPVFGELAPSFEVAMGHEDCVDQLPPGAVLLAYSERSPHQAFTFPNRPLYATQFHPELTREHLLQRVAAYPQYVERISGLSPEEFAKGCRDTPAARTLIRRFLKHVRLL